MDINQKVNLICDGIKHGCPPPVAFMFLADLTPVHLNKIRKTILEKRKEYFKEPQKFMNFQNSADFLVIYYNHNILGKILPSQRKGQELQIKIKCPHILKILSNT